MVKIVTVRKVGSSLIMTVPKQIADVVGIEVGTRMEIEILKKDILQPEFRRYW
jgi:antitoxin component of MazEF toxin-antitoxin module